MENKLYHLKVVRLKLRENEKARGGFTGKFEPETVEELEDGNAILSKLVSQKDKLLSGMDSLETFLDRKQNPTLSSYDEVCGSRNVVTATAATISKQGYAKVIEPLNRKPKKFINDIRKLVAEQNLKVEHNIRYEYDLQFFKVGRNKDPNSIIFKAIKYKNGIEDSLIWVGLIDDSFHVIYKKTTE